ncbi:MAG: sel1 repeat family protein, partial [Candidatus Hydrogenedentes bacterium]|nr:sel1 repeat family protein [Candidatus Hydrogenedentota bacterium]
MHRNVGIHPPGMKRRSRGVQRMIAVPNHFPSEVATVRLFVVIALVVLSALRAYGQATGVDADVDTLSRLIEQAEAGDAGQQFILGLMYKYGQGVPNVTENHEEAVKWFRKAADQG